MLRFFERHDAEDAIDSMDGRSYDGRELRVAMAKYGRPEGGRSGGGGGGGSDRRGGYGYDRRRRWVTWTYNIADSCSVVEDYHTMS